MLPNLQRPNQSIIQMKFNRLYVHGGQNGLTRTTVLLLLYFIFLQLSAAQPTTPPGPGSELADDYYKNTKFSPAMGVLLIVLISVLFMMGFFSIYIRSCADSSSTTRAPGSIQRMINTGLSRRGPRGLDQSVIESFPTFGYSEVKTLRIGKGTLECAVCLNEFGDEETLRLIPKCDHVFHPECIDQWLGSHTTCPVCRADLKPIAPNDDGQPELARISESHLHQEDDDNEIRNTAVVIELGQPPVRTSSGTRRENNETMERPILTVITPDQEVEDTIGLNRRSRTPRGRNNSTSGRNRWLGMFSRSISTGHVAVRQWEDVERFTLRIPEEVRKQIISGKLNRTTSCVALPRESSSRRGYRGGGSYRELGGGGRRTTNGRLSDRNEDGRSGRWLFSLTPSFLFRSPSVRSPRVAADGGSGGSVRLNPNQTCGLGGGLSSSRVESVLPPV